ncbi:MAG: hypothetical protein WCH34_06575 [Bacteroidota bacterium]
MKKVICLVSLVSCLFCGQILAKGNSLSDSLGLPGDNFNLYAVLDIFQKSPTLEQFEKNINLQDSKVNNLDLNGDGQIDYVKVVDHGNSNIHAIVLQVAINETEIQDVAVIEVEKENNSLVKLQIIGDEALYGKDYIIEPIKEKSVQETPNPGYTGGNTTVNNVTNNYYSNDNSYAGSEVAAWAIIGFMFAPAYIYYVSPYHWGYYPVYWHPWRPWFYHHYHSFHHSYYGHYHQTHYYRAPAAHSYYGTRRSSSVIVDKRSKSGAYMDTYKRTPKTTTNNNRLPSSNKQSPINKSTQTIKQSPLNKNTPVHKLTPVNKQSPVNYQKPVNKTPVNKQQPGYNQTPTHKQQPTYNQSPVNKQQPSYNQTPINKQQPTYNQSPINKQQPVNKSLPVNKQSQNNYRTPSNSQLPSNRQAPSNNERNNSNKPAKDGGRK